MIFCGSAKVIRIGASFQGLREPKSLFNSPRARLGVRFSLANAGWPRRSVWIAADEAEVRETCLMAVPGASSVVGRICLVAEPPLRSFTAVANMPEWANWSTHLAKTLVYQHQLVGIVSLVYLIPER